MSDQLSVVSNQWPKRWANIGQRPEDEEVLRPEVARRLVAYGLRTGLLRIPHRSSFIRIDADSQEYLDPSGVPSSINHQPPTINRHA